MRLQDENFLYVRKDQTIAQPSSEPEISRESDHSLVSSHVGWREEQNISYMGVKISL